MINSHLQFERAGHPRVGIALGCGSARGLAHFGVIRALTEAGIDVEFVAGTSIGSLVGAVFADGTIDAMEAAFRKMDRRRTLSFFDVVLPKSGLLDGAKLNKLLQDHLNAKLIEDLPKLFHAVATDILSGEEVVLRSGSIVEAVRASTSVPGIFTPFRCNGYLLVDGGLVNPVPVSTARAMGAEIVIAVDVNHHVVASKNLIPLRVKAATGNAGKMLRVLSRWGYPNRNAPRNEAEHLEPAPPQFTDWASPNEALPSIFEVLLAAINIMENRITQSQLRTSRADLIIQPPLGHINFLEFNRADEIIAIGYECARRQLAAHWHNLLQAPPKSPFRRKVPGQHPDGNYP